MIDPYRASFPDCLKMAWESETRLTPTNHVASTLHSVLTHKVVTREEVSVKNVQKAH